MSDAKLKRELGLTSAIMITVGSVIGSGIFLKPLDIAKNLPDPLTIYVFWIAIGVVCLCGALAYAELGAMLPGAGGQYTFLREAWGPLVAFLFGWCYFLVINTGTMSALAVTVTGVVGRRPHRCCNRDGPNSAARQLACSRINAGCCRTLPMKHSACLTRLSAMRDCSARWTTAFGHWKTRSTKRSVRSVAFTTAPNKRLARFWVRSTVRIDPF